MGYLISTIKYVLTRIDHYYHRDKCVDNAYYILGVLVCNKCNRHLGYEEYINIDENLQKTLHIYKPYKNYLE